MILCSKTGVCPSSLEFIIHHLDKLVGLFTGIVISLILFFTLKFSFKIKESTQKSFIESKYLDFPNNIFFNSLKRAIAKGLIQPKLAPPIS